MDEADFYGNMSEEDAKTEEEVEKKDESKKEKADEIITGAYAYLESLE